MPGNKKRSTIKRQTPCFWSILHPLCKVASLLGSEKWFYASECSINSTYMTTKIIILIVYSVNDSLIIRHQIKI